ncbi:MAG: bacillithiol biosynthesis deacetylase BshB1, partial [Chitinophagales bacterium]|nr:bacillithiol biosynthesis deacetylase BshB1 [Chitinophagales bacterium]
MKLDILVFAAHPDDVELSCSGTVLKHIQLGYKVGIIDLTQGELGSRGTAEIRAIESKNASQILGIHHRENLGFKDGFFEIDEAHLLKVIQVIRKFQPSIVLVNAKQDRHPDHKRGGDLVSRAAFLSGLVKIETNSDG